MKFDALRAANRARIPTFKNAKGELAHKSEDGSDWTPSQWLEALVGELGEYANKRKKFMRGDISLEEFRVEAEKELADVQIYLDLLAMRCLDHGDQIHAYGVDLGKATINKFNEMSDRVGSPIYLQEDGENWYWSE